MMIGMKRNACILALVLMAAELHGCGPEIISSGPHEPPPPTRDQITGNWLAIFSFQAYRLDLSSDGTGLLTAAFGGQTRRYKTHCWKLEGWNLSATFIPVEDALQPVYLTATATPQSIWNVSISLSSTSRSPVADEFVREERLMEMIDVLVPTPAPSGTAP